MVSSSSRKGRRQLLGANRKSEVIWWIGCTTVRVVISRCTGRGCTYVKADEGAEKSCRIRRKGRGLRRGSRRARGGKPPRTVTPALKPKVAKNRSIVRHVRAFDFWEGRSMLFGKLIDRSGLKRHSFPRGAAERKQYLVWKHRWQALSCRIFPSGRLMRDTLICPSFPFYLDQRYGIRPPQVASPAATLSLLAEGLRKIDDPITPAGNKPRRPHVFTLTCQWCGTAWSYPTKSGFCPDCKRLCVAVPNHPGNGYRHKVRFGSTRR